MNKLNQKQNIFNDNIGFVEQYDFSTANMSEENRIKAITTVASICYQNPKAIGSESLYNRLLAESQGLPSSSFEFVPVLLNEEELEDLQGNTTPFNQLELKIFKHSEQIEYNDSDYLLTNFRALLYDVENGFLDKEWLKRFNTKEECEIIKQHSKVFKYKVDLPTRSQMVRHRVSWQELSRRYVSGKRVPLEFYISPKMKKVVHCLEGEQIFNTEDCIDFCIDLYNTALENGVKPEEARRILPQGLYTEIWGAYQPKQLDNFFKLRLDKSAQKEIRLVAEAMQELIV
ncbi:MAG TPA: FAD-dependent thymidylate synthase [Aliarcobacter sp.]|nr:FAD-dependent thymidylate synthase [Aliarcobacter sp.]